jgi:hypothetical protein
MRLLSGFRLPAALVLTVSQSLFAANFIDKGYSGLMLFSAVLCVLGPPVVFLLLMGEMGEKERQHRARLGLD